MSQESALTAERMIAALEKAHGFVSAACTALGCSRKQFYARLKCLPTVQEAMVEIREKRTDFVESQLLQNIKAGKEVSILFYLKTQAKDRGYIERQEVRTFNTDMSKLSDEELRKIIEGGDVSGLS